MERKQEIKRMHIEIEEFQMIIHNIYIYIYIYIYI